MDKRLKLYIEKHGVRMMILLSVTEKRKVWIE